MTISTDRADNDTSPTCTRDAQDVQLRTPHLNIAEQLRRPTGTTAGDDDDLALQPRRTGISGMPACVGHLNDTQVMVGSSRNYACLHELEVAGVQDVVLLFSLWGGSRLAEGRPQTQFR